MFLTAQMASYQESLSERQEYELQILEAIYIDEVTDLRKKDAWKVLYKQFSELTGRGSINQHITLVSFSIDKFLY